MKTRRIFNLKSGFTLVELLVSMAVTMIIVTVLVSVTSMAMDTWNRSRSELRASRQAKAMVDTMARDFEGLVTRSGNNFEWLSATVDSSDDVGESSNASKLIFFTASTDRYNGEVGTDNNDNPDHGGDVSCVGYKLAWKDPIGEESGKKFKTFVLNRLLVSPKTGKVKNNPEPGAFEMLGSVNLETTFDAFNDNLKEEEKLDSQTNYVCENIFQFTVTFYVQVMEMNATVNPPVTVIRNVQVTLGQDTTKFQIFGNGNITDYTGDFASLVPKGKITAVGISLSVLSDAGISQLRDVPTKAENAEWLAKNSNQYSKVIQLPSM